MENANEFLIELMTGLESRGLPVRTGVKDFTDMHRDYANSMLQGSLTCVKKWKETSKDGDTLVLDILPNMLSLNVTMKGGTFITEFIPLTEVLKAFKSGEDYTIPDDPQYIQDDTIRQDKINTMLEIG